MAKTTRTLTEISRMFDPAHVHDGAHILDPRDLPIPLIIDESDNLIDGYHRALGMVQWAADNGSDPETIRVDCVEIPDELGEELWGVALSDDEAQEIIARYGDA